MTHRNTLVATVAAVALLVTACGGSHHRATPTTQAPPTSVPPSSTPAGPCTARAVQATFTVQPPVGTQPATRVRAVVGMTNASSSPCTVFGYAGIGTTNGGTVASVDVARVAVPGPPTAFQLAPGQTAFAGAEWTSGTCAPAGGLVLTPPNDTAQVTATLVGASAARLCVNVDLGPFQPSAEGVVAFPDISLPPTTTGVGACVTAGLRGSFTVIPGSRGAGQISARVVLTNTGSAPCRTGGYVGMQLLGPGGALLPTTVVRLTTVTPVTLTLAPGASASATARYSPDIAGPGDATNGPCQPTAVSTEVTPPNDTSHLVVTGPGTAVCERGTLRVTALQAGANAGPA